MIWAFPSRPGKGAMELELEGSPRRNDRGQPTPSSRTATHANRQPGACPGHQGGEYQVECLVAQRCISLGGREGQTDYARIRCTMTRTFRQRKNPQNRDGKSLSRQRLPSHPAAAQSTWKALFLRARLRFSTAALRHRPSTQPPARTARCRAGCSIPAWSWRAPGTPPRSWD